MTCNRDACRLTCLTSRTWPNQHGGLPWPRWRLLHFAGLRRLSSLTCLTSPTSLMSEESDLAEPAMQSHLASLEIISPR